jgi:hypothetical protein
MIYGEGRYADGQFFSGFSLCNQERGVIGVDASLHRDTDVYSFNWAFRRLLATILATDALAAETIKHLPDQNGAPEISSFFFSLPYDQVIARVNSLSGTASPGEELCLTPAVQLSRHSEGLSVEEILVNETACTMRLIVDVLSHIVRFKQPYGKGELNFEIKPNEGTPRLPIGEYLRIIIGDFVVEPRSPRLHVA